MDLNLMSLFARKQKDGLAKFGGDRKLLKSDYTNRDYAQSVSLLYDEIQKEVLS